MKKVNFSRSINTFVIATTLLTLISCGKTPPPPPPPPQIPPPTGGAGLGGGLNVNPGNVQTFSAYDFHNNLVGSATAQIVAESISTYSATSNTSGGQITPQGSPITQQQVSQQSSFNLQIAITGPERDGVPSAVLVLRSVYGGESVFQLRPNVQIAPGVWIWTTDQQAVFVMGQSQAGSLTIAKVALKSKNPAVQVFIIKQGGVYGNQPQPNTQPNTQPQQGPTTFLEVRQINLTTTYGAGQQVPPRY